MSDTVTLPPEEELVEEAPVPTRRMLVFVVDGRAFACEMDAFREIVPTRQMTRLPGAPSTVCGLINLRGSIVTVLDGGVCLGGAECMRSGGLILLIDLGQRLIGLGVDDVRDLHDIPENLFFDAAPDEVQGMSCVTASVELEGERVLVLDIRSVARQVIGQGR
jgi:purine-binding chemotaxis protein CheW